MQLTDITVFGDSLMRATSPDENLRPHFNIRHYTDRLRDEHGLTLSCRASFGATVSRGLEDLQRTLSRGISSSHVLLEYGGNDCDFNWAEVAASPDGEHQPHASVERFSDTLLSMIRALQARKIQPILTTLPPLDAQKYLNFIGRLGSDTGKILHWLGDVQMIYRWQERYSNAVARLADRLSLPLADIRSEFLARRDYCTLIARDGIHLTRPGYELVFSTLSKTLCAL